MTEGEKIFLGVLGVALAAIVVYNRMGVPISVSSLAAGAGPAPNSAAPANSPLQYAWMTDVSPWGSAPPMMPMMRRSSGVAGIPTPPHWSLSCGGRCN